MVTQCLRTKSARMSCVAQHGLESGISVLLVLAMARQKQTTKIKKKTIHLWHVLLILRLLRRHLDYLSHSLPLVACGKLMLPHTPGVHLGKSNDPLRLILQDVLSAKGVKFLWFRWNRSATHLLTFLMSVTLHVGLALVKNLATWYA